MSSDWVDVASLRVRVLGEDDVAQLAGWEYAGQHLADGAIPGDRGYLLDRANSYYAVIAPDDSLVAFCCFGPSAQVAGVKYPVSGIDVRAGLRPELTGGEQTARYLAAIVVFAKALFRPFALRTAISAANELALDAYQAAGFRRRSILQGSNGESLVTLTLESE